MNAPRIAVLLPLACAAVAVAVVLFWPKDRRFEPDEASGSPTRVEVASEHESGELSIPNTATNQTRKPIAASPIPSSSAVRPSKSSPMSGTRPVVLTGRITDSSGKPISSLRASVRVTDPRGSVRQESVFAGLYSIDGCPEGHLDLGCEAAGFRPLARAIEILPGEQEHHEDFALEPGWLIAVQILTSDGHRVRDPAVKHERLLGDVLAVEARVPGENEGRGTFVHRTESEWFLGEYVADTDGVLDVRIDPPIDVVVRSSDSIVATVRVENRVDRVTVEIPAAALASNSSELVGRVVDSASLEAVSDVAVMLVPSQGVRTKTDAAGKFSATHLRPGPCTLTIANPRYGFESRSVQLLPGKVTDVGTIALETPILLRGQFVDAGGRPADAEASLHVCEDPRLLESIQSNFAYSLQASEDGRFESSVLAHKKYVMLVRPFLRTGAEAPDWHAPPILLDLTRGSVPDLVITVHSGVDLILRPATEAARDLGYWITSGDSIPECYGCFAGSGVVAERLAPGNYELVLGRGETIVRRIPFKLGEEPLTLDVAP